MSTVRLQCPFCEAWIWLDDSRYCFLHHKSVDEALDWLIANVDRDKILD